jgi:two-component system response regulator YesN
MTVLIAEDEPPTLRALVKMITDWGDGYHVVGTVRDGRQAIEFIDLKAPDLVLTDIRMPGTDGIQVIRHCRTHHPAIKVLVLSGYKDFEIVREALVQGASDYLLKPVRPGELRRMFDTLAPPPNPGTPWPGLTIPLGSARPLTIPATTLTYPVSALCLVASHLSLALLEQSNVRGLSVEDSFWRTLPPFVSTNARTTLANTPAAVVLLEGIGPHRDTVKRWFQRNLDSLGMPVTAYWVPDLKAESDIRDRVPRLPTLAFARARYGQTRWVEPTETEAEVLGIPRLDRGTEEQWDQALATGDEGDVDRAVERVLSQLEVAGAGPGQIVETWAYLVRFGTRGQDQDTRPWVEGVSAAVAQQVTYRTLRPTLTKLFVQWSRRRKAAESSLGSLEDRVEAFLQAKIDRPLSVHDIATALGYHPDYLGKAYKKATGERLTRAIVVHKVTQAKVLWAQSPGATVTEIAARVGFDDPLYFSRVFKLVTGKPPTDYRDEAPTGRVPPTN